MKRVFTKRFICILTAIFLIAAISYAQQQELQAGKRIKTSWGESLKTEQVWNVYPRPIMQRTDWQCLNGYWEYAILEKGKAEPVRYDGKILVPFCVESALSGVEKTLDAEHELWYRRSFTVPSLWKGKDILLNFGAVDWRADVWVNGIKVGSHTGGYTSFALNITAALRKGQNELVVRVSDSTTAGFQPCGKQRMNPKGIWYTPVSGIWQTVWMEPVDKQYIRRLVIVPDIDRGVVGVEVVKNVSSPATITELRLKERGALVATAKVLDNQQAVLHLPVGFRLWTPDSPNLYDLEITLSHEGKIVDQVRSYVAMRKFSTGRDGEGHVRLLLNNEPVFEFGPLDQGWWPDGLYTAPSYEAMAFDIEKTKAWGFNMIRKHVKVEPETWYHYCDKAGIIVWQDMPSGDYSHGQPWNTQPASYYNEYQTRRSTKSEENFYKEWREIIDQLRSYPCISTWVPFNEGWGQFKTTEVAQWTKAHDPYHLVNAASGGNLEECGDIIDFHHYPNPQASFFDGNRVNVIGEYGGLGLPVSGHLWVESNDNWGYVKYKNAQELTDKYEELAEELIALARKGYCAGVYTQTTDCEMEVNGIMTYDRKVVKMDENRLRTINRRVTESITLKK